jgi:hypothetical protein
MGLDSFKAETDDGNSTADDKVTEKREETTKQYIARAMRERALNSPLDIDVSGDTIEGDTDDIAMLFALMTMDIEDASFHSLIGGDDEQE